MATFRCVGRNTRPSSSKGNIEGMDAASEENTVSGLVFMECVKDETVCFPVESVPSCPSLSFIDSSLSV